MRGQISMDLGGGALTYNVLCDGMTLLMEGHGFYAEYHRVQGTKAFCLVREHGPLAALPQGTACVLSKVSKAVLVRDKRVAHDKTIMDHEMAHYWTSKISSKLTYSQREALTERVRFLVFGGNPPPTDMVTGIETTTTLTTPTPSLPKDTTRLRLEFCLSYNLTRYVPKVIPYTGHPVKA